MSTETHPWDRHYNKVFIILLVCGIALCIGGIWLPPLLVPGGVALTGAAAMYASAYTRMYPWSQDDLMAQPKADLETGHATNIQIDNINILNQFNFQRQRSNSLEHPSKELVEGGRPHSDPPPRTLDLF